MEKKMETPICGLGFRGLNALKGVFIGDYIGDYYRGY